jgi:hypothetical protein
MSSASAKLAGDPLRSVHTKNFLQLLSQLGASLLVTNYQAGKLVLRRNDEGHVPQLDRLRIWGTFPKLGC